MIVESRKVSPKTTDPKVYPGCSILGISNKYKQTYRNQRTCYFFNLSKYIISKIIKPLYIIKIIIVYQTGQKIIYDSFSIKISHVSKELTTMAMIFKQLFQSDESYALRVNFVLLVKKIAHTVLTTNKLIS